MENVNDKMMPDDLKASIERFMSLLEQFRNNGELDLFSALFQTDFRIISYLAGKKDVHPSDLAETLRETRPAIAASLRTLEKKDFIERKVNPENRREVFVNLTDSGIRYYQVCEKQLAILFASWFQILGREDTESLFRILEKSARKEYVSDELRSFSFGGK